jgi:hypothetical protein
VQRPATPPAAAYDRWIKKFYCTVSILSVGICSLCGCLYVALRLHLCICITMHACFAWTVTFGV